MDTASTTDMEPDNQTLQHGVIRLISDDLPGSTSGRKDDTGRESVRRSLDVETPIKNKLHHLFAQHRTQQHLSAALVQLLIIKLAPAGRE